jgi:5'-phosphate synthase pdxT subunit
VTTVKRPRPAGAPGAPDPRSSLPPALAVGVLALQGGFEAHRQALLRAAAEVGVAADALLVRRGAQCEGLDGLVLPGGESTTLLKLLAEQGIDAALPAFLARGGHVLATCAGLILLAREVTHPAQASLGLLDALVERNSYGRQVDSFVAEVAVAPAARHELGERLPAVFIRAPRLRRLGPGVEVLARHHEDPVLVREGRVLAATYHPELTEDLRVHRLFVAACAGARLAERAVG